MVAFHLCYDLKFIEGVDLTWFAPPFQDIWRCSISWVFLFIAGCMCPLSRSNARRGLVYGATALAIWAVTTLAAVDDAINFGIIYCMAACTLVAAGLQRLGLLPKGYVAAAILFVAFLALLGLQGGTVLGGHLELPSEWFSTRWFDWLGLPGPGFSSGDYYPLLPYLLLYLAGSSCGSVWAKTGYPDWAINATLNPLNLIGRHALLIYILHQPLILFILMLVT